MSKSNSNLSVPAALMAVMAMIALEQLQLHSGTKNLRKLNSEETCPYDLGRSFVLEKFQMAWVVTPGLGSALIVIVS